MITITNPGGLVIIVTLTKHENKRINNNNNNIAILLKFTYRIVASTSPSRIEAHAGLFRSLMKGIFDPYVL